MIRHKAHTIVSWPNPKQWLMIPTSYLMMIIRQSTHKIPCILQLMHTVRTLLHYCDVLMGAMASQITSLTIVYSTVHSGADQRKHQSSVSLAFVPGIHRWPVNSPHKWPVTRKMFHLMTSSCLLSRRYRGIYSTHISYVIQKPKRSHESH